jgi:predicted ATP-grasp superfamily ATP-dependent carboligase
MAAAVAADLAAAGHEVTGVRDEALVDLPPPLDGFQAVSDGVDIGNVEVAGGPSDYFLLIAPESDQVLAHLAGGVEQAGGRLLGPSSEFIRWASDKHGTALTLGSLGAMVPRGHLLRPGSRWPADIEPPAILKPNDGCGSQDVRLVDWLPPELADTSLRPANEPASTRLWRLEEFVDGIPASIAVLRGPGGIYLLPPCSQDLADDGSFAYQGGTCPLEPALEERAMAAAHRAMRGMKPWHGYIGLDLVLGPDEDGLSDYLIEVNPRLTTSYIGLRALSRTNLAAAMIDVVEGRTPNLEFQTGYVDFTADGMVNRR